jgi:hypothetical protein
MMPVKDSHARTMLMQQMEIVSSELVKAMATR